MKLYEQKLLVSVIQDKKELSYRSFNLESLSLSSGLWTTRTMGQPDISLVVNGEAILDIYSEPHRGISPKLTTLFEHKYEGRVNIVSRDVLNNIPKETENRSNMCRQLGGRRQDVLNKIHRMTLQDLEIKFRELVKEYAVEKKSLYTLMIDLDEYSLKASKLIGEFLDPSTNDNKGYGVETKRH